MVVAVCEAVETVVYFGLGKTCSRYGWRASGTCSALRCRPAMEWPCRTMRMFWQADRTKMVLRWCRRCHSLLAAQHRRPGTRPVRPATQAAEGLASATAYGRLKVVSAAHLLISKEARAIIGGATREGTHLQKAEEAGLVMYLVFSFPSWWSSLLIEAHGGRQLVAGWQAERLKGMDRVDDWRREAVMVNAGRPLS